MSKYGKLGGPGAWSYALPAMAAMAGWRMRKYTSGYGKKRQFKAAASKFNRRSKYGRYGKRRPGRRVMRRARDLRLQRQVNMLKKRVEAGMGTFVWKWRDAINLTCNANSKNRVDVVGSSVTAIEGAIDALPVFNPANPGTLLTVNFTTGTYQKEVEIASTVSSVVLKNNYDVPCVCKVYVCVPREDTNIPAATAITNGFTDAGSGLTGTTPMLGPMDSEQFKSLYRIARTYKKQLGPGGMMVCKYRFGSFQYDPSYVDSHSQNYQVAYGGHLYHIEIEGVLGHDTTAAEYGRLPAGVDIQANVTYVVKYEAGADLKYIEVVDGNNGFTNGGVVTTYDVEKEGYSVN